jgi:hypothetical protein
MVVIEEQEKKPEIIIERNPTQRTDIYRRPSCLENMET